MKISLIIFIFAATAAQAETLSKKPRFAVPGLGQVHVKHEVPNEPISQPERLEIFVACGKTKMETRIAIFRMCKYEGYTFEEGTKTLSVNLYYGRVVPTTGDVICDQHDIKTIELANACSTAKRK